MSKLNCRPGDLARIVNSEAGNNDKIVLCVRFAGLVPFGFIGARPKILAGWVIDRELRGGDGRYSNVVEDCKLRPIRDNPGEDETLTWAGKPADVPAGPVEV